MKRTTAIGNVSNLYTLGNPSLGVPATVVGADEMNNLQEELCSIVEAAGITLNGTVHTQVLAAILALMQQGGSATQILTIANNQSAAVNLTGLLYDAASIVAVQIPFSLARYTTTGHLIENGRIYLAYDAAALTWRISVDSRLDDAGVTFEVTAQGQVTYKSTNMSGAAYTGQLRVAGVLVFKKN